MTRLLPIAIACMLLAPRPAQAWGLEAHRFIMDRAIALLPADLRPLFERHRAEVVERADDPDLWIAAGWQDERPRHFLNMDEAGTGPYPFDGLPRDYAAALAKFGAAKMRVIGTLPWRTEEMYGSLVRAFEAYPRRGDTDVIHFASWLAHYTSDAHVPLHAVTNYNGQLTGQTGLHARWETDLFERYRDRLTIAPMPMAPIRDPRAYVFSQLLEDTTIVPALLRADRAAIRTRSSYDGAYYDSLFAAEGATLARRLDDSIAAVAAMITGAWETAGRPAVTTPASPPPQRQRRRPRSRR